MKPNSPLENWKKTKASVNVVILKNIIFTISQANIVVKKLIKMNILGDGKDEEGAAKNMNFPFWRINSHNDLVAFYNALDRGYL